MCGNSRMVELVDPFWDRELHMLDKVFPGLVDFLRVDFVGKVE